MKLTLLLSLLNLQCYLGLGKSEPILIIALPQSDTEVSASWERGEEILPGALAAAKEANNDSLSFSLRVANSGPVTRYNLPYSGNVLEIIANLTWQNRVADIIGIAGLLHPSVLATMNRFQLPIISLIHFNEAPQNMDIHYMTASTSTLTDSILAFLREIRLKNIGIITEIEQTYYFKISDELRTKANISLKLYVQIVNKHQKSFSSIADQVIASNVHVILLSVGPSTAIPMLCEAYKSGLRWPKYAWILHSYRLDDLLRSFELNEGCSVQKILEGIFIFQLMQERDSFNTETVYYNMSRGEFNPYADLLYDSAWALILSVDNSSFAHSNEVSHFNPDCSKVYIYRNTNCTASLIGVYDGTSRSFINVSEITFTNNDLPVVSRLVAPYLLPLPILCFLVNTVLLVLYVYFRNEPSIKSTSVSLSMLIFTGCYFLVGFNVVFTLNRQYRFDFCTIGVWLSTFGLPLPLILAIILVRMLRVYHIFTSFKLLKQSSKYKDCTLLAYIILIISPNIMLLTLWTAIDPFRKVDNLIEHPGFIRVERSCYSEYAFVWFALAFAYFYLLLVAVVIVAVKSRKIRYAQFKDTKKINLFIFLLFIICTCCFIYWQILLYAGLYFASLVILYVDHMLIAILCQIILLVPKVWPSIQKKIIFVKSPQFFRKTVV